MVMIICTNFGAFISKWTIDAPIDWTILEIYSHPTQSTQITINYSTKEIAHWASSYARQTVATESYGQNLIKTITVSTWKRRSYELCPVTKEDRMRHAPSFL